MRGGGRITCLVGLHGSSVNLRFYLDMLGVVVQTCKSQILGRKHEAGGLGVQNCPGQTETRQKSRDDIGN